MSFDSTTYWYVVLAVKPERPKRWLVTNVPLNAFAVEPPSVRGVVVPYHTLLVAASFVVHKTCAVVADVEEAEIAERIGAAVSGVPVVKVTSLEVAVLPEASFEMTRK